jgi:hypothetical protein
MAFLLRFETAITRLTPPWLQRSVGGRVMRGIASVVDEHVDRLSGGVRIRFPGFDPLDIDPDALALTGRERRILRGPGETAATYASRLRTWWDAHRLRGGPYALLEQLRAFFAATYPVRMDVVAQSGTRYWMDEDGVITRDSIVWEGDGTGKWARIWVFFYLTALPASLITHAGDVLVTHAGDTLIGEALGGGEVSDEFAALFTAIPREWSAAHIDKTTVVLLAGDAVLVGYPPRLVSDPPNTVAPTTAAVILEIVH